jgi:hypothetical protein
MYFNLPNTSVWQEGAVVSESQVLLAEGFLICLRVLPHISAYCTAVRTAIIFDTDGQDTIIIEEFSFQYHQLT